MSNSGSNVEQPERAAFQKLERAVGDALEALGSARLRAHAAEERSSELEELLRRFSDDDAAAGQLLTRLRTLEHENTDLRGRIEKGREGVERLLARIRFLEGQR